MMTSKYTLQRTMDGNTVYVINGWRYDGSAKICDTEAEARAYIREHCDYREVMRVIADRDPRNAGKYTVVVRER